jgi:hypothetical protein
MNLDEWVTLVKGVGPDAFKAIALAFLRERYRCHVQYTDGTGDGGVDAWVVLSGEPPVRAAAQFHAGTSSWQTKLSKDLKAMAAFRDSLASSNPKVRDFKRLLFVCTQAPAATDVEAFVQDAAIDHGISVQVFDARAIASIALAQNGEVWRLLAQRLPGYADASTALADPRDEVRLAFSFFDEAPDQYRRAIAKSTIATVLHRDGPCPREALIEESSALLGLAAPTNFLRNALTNLASERLVEEAGDVVQATSTLAESTRATLAVAETERTKLRAECIRAIEPFVAKGKHHRVELAAEAVDAVFADLGALVRYPIAATVAAAVQPSNQRRVTGERDAINRWRSAAQRVAAALDSDDGGIAPLQTLVSRIASDPFAKRLAAAELFASLVEHDAQEFERALSAPSQRVLLDTSIGMPVLCALFAKPVSSWPTSSAAHALYQSLRARSARIAMASVHVEEIAAHLLNARKYIDNIEKDVELSRSKNYFVAHYCSMREQSASRRNRHEFAEFLRDFGGPEAAGYGPWEQRRERAELEVTKLLERYSIEVQDLDDAQIDVPLPNEPRREPVVLQHDRAVVRSLVNRRTADSRWLVCSADVWLRGVLNDRGVVALDSVGLVDLLELVRPSGAQRPVFSTIVLATSLRDEARERSSTVWDAIIQVESGNLEDRELQRKAREFRDLWLQRRNAEDDVAVEWERFRDTGVFSER